MLEVGLIIIAVVGFVGSLITIYDKKKTMRFRFKRGRKSYEKDFLRVKNKLNSFDFINAQVLICQGPHIQPPVLINEGAFVLPKNSLKKLSNLKGRELKNAKRPNDPCAVLPEKLNWEDNPLTLRFKSIWYSELCALREDKNTPTPTLITANAVLYSEDEQCLLVHRRSGLSDLFPNTLSSFGGAFMPNGLGDRFDSDLLATVQREVSEESSLWTQISQDNTPSVVINEHSMNSLEVTYLGVNISKEQLAKMDPNWEGSLVKLRFDELGDELADVSAWVITGWVSILLWLSTGIPNSQSQIKFSGKAPIELCDEIINNLRCDSMLSDTSNKREESKAAS
ncbi:hypothetical protein [Shewanella kaireitica]|uniref:hypothetical protein n=1 Tax=Shewanella kaireitica TaxID=212021 RepID=UPI00200DF6B0|nr:hypothetical protein [Shewanella kaireitica]MCL1095853.1 hypothetical protein [Shewanella kaireitica]